MSMPGASFGHDRSQLDRLWRYLARPPLADDRHAELPDRRSFAVAQGTLVRRHCSHRAVAHGSDRQVVCAGAATAHPPDPLLRRAGFRKQAPPLGRTTREPDPTWCRPCSFPGSTTTVDARRRLSSPTRCLARAVTPAPGCSSACSKQSFRLPASFGEPVSFSLSQAALFVLKLGPSRIPNRDAPPPSS